MQSGHALGTALKVKGAVWGKWPLESQLVPATVGYHSTSSTLSSFAALRETGKHSPLGKQRVLKKNSVPKPS